MSGSPDRLADMSDQVRDGRSTRWDPHRHERRLAIINAAIDEGTPVPVLSAALYQRFSSRGEEDFANKVLSAMRFGFGGHVEKKGGA